MEKNKTTFLIHHVTVTLRYAALFINPKTVLPKSFYPK